MTGTVSVTKSSTVIGILPSFKASDCREIKCKVKSNGVGTLSLNLFEFMIFLSNLTRYSIENSPPNPLAISYMLRSTRSFILMPMTREIMDTTQRI